MSADILSAVPYHKVRVICKCRYLPCLNAIYNECRTIPQSKPFASCANPTMVLPAIESHYSTKRKPFASAFLSSLGDRLRRPVAASLPMCCYCLSAMFLVATSNLMAPTRAPQNACRLRFLSLPGIRNVCGIARLPPLCAPHNTPLLRCACGGGARGACREATDKPQCLRHYQARILPAATTPAHISSPRAQKRKPSD